MEKLVVKGSKEIKMHLADSIQQTIQTLGVLKPKKKTKKLIAKSSKKLAKLVGKQMKKELKKIASLKKRADGKKEKHEELATA
ncbi:MAG: hypothetical protein HY015_01050 [Bacteroidetes bacterium]|nr:hypothetical protein [Bacteroidota bacterium]MBI3481565.1 hypothetical protein [Bacteroidota bacterium]